MYSKIYPLLLSILILTLFVDDLMPNCYGSEGLNTNAGRYVEINNVSLYFEIIGEGPPLLYLHGGLSSSRDFKNFIDRTRNMWLHDPYISKEDFMNINIPVLLVAGDRDDIRLDHMIEMHTLLRKSQLCILPNTTHFVFEEYNDTVKNIFIEFLKQEVD